jgi:hypothetical protein
MPILFAAKHTQGGLRVACDRDRDNIDGGCGCRRSLAGVVSRRATTTFKVAEIDGDAETLHRIFERS